MLDVAYRLPDVMGVIPADYPETSKLCANLTEHGSVRLALNCWGHRNCNFVCVMVAGRQAQRGQKFQREYRKVNLKGCLSSHW